MYMRMFCFIIVFYTCLTVCAQEERCGTTRYKNRNQPGKYRTESEEQFENWLNTINSIQKRNTLRTQSTYTIPVVVHIIHNGEPVGTGLNISDEQIFSQLKVLNNDFNRLNADAINTPTDFKAVAGSLNIQFVLAKQDPNGVASNGIVRVKGSKTIWNGTDEDERVLKSQSYWPAERYLNIWVTHIKGILGYAVYPNSTLVRGLNASYERLIDGVVVSYLAFGSIQDGLFNLSPQVNRGRTLTHEVGHFFGLYHLWGNLEDGCFGTDYVSDTPPQNGNSSGCPTHPQKSCEDKNKMFQNYLDYSTDVCMNLFTKGQVDRMNVIIQNSPRRKELLTSTGSILPIPVANDLGISSILAPGNTICKGTFTPSIVVKNYGNNDVVNAQLILKLNGNVIETKTISTTITAQSESQINFNSIVLNEKTTYSLEFEITTVNRVANANKIANKKSITTQTPTPLSPPIQENFTLLSSDWSIINFDKLNTWSTTTVLGQPTICMNSFNYKEIGAVDQLITPSIDLTNSNRATLIFDKAYAAFTDTKNREQFRVLVSTQCRFDNSSVVSVLDQSDQTLDTAPKSSYAFIPTPSQWKTEVISLDQFIGKSMQIAFESTNANGNNLYIKNLKIVNGDFLDISLAGLRNPSLVTCLPNPTPEIKIKNNGNVTIQSLTIQYTLNGVLSKQNYTGLSILPNQEQNVLINPLSLNAGKNELKIQLLEPNTIADNNLENNSNTYTILLTTEKEPIPLRETFDVESNFNWSIVSQPQYPTWQKVKTQYGNSLAYFSTNESKNIGESWLVTPILDFSQVDQASLSFHTKYDQSIPTIERLNVFSSTDCGNTFSKLIFTQDAQQWKNANNSPKLAENWKSNWVNLTDLIGEKNVRLAFVSQNGLHNNLYLDNINFYVENNPTLVPIQSAYSIYSVDQSAKITFNLSKKQSVSIQAFNSIGQLIGSTDISDVLNQTFSIDLDKRGPGLYIFRIQLENEIKSQKVYISDNSN